MADGDVIVIIKQVTKVTGTDFTDLDAFTGMPATAEDVRVQVIPRTDTSDVLYDVVATGVATV